MTSVTVPTSDVLVSEAVVSPVVSPAAAVAVSTAAPGLFDRAYSVFSQNVVRPWQRRHLIGDLAKLLNMAKAHEANELPIGHKFYLALNEQALARVTEYSVAWNVSVPQLMAELPALEVLRRLANPSFQAGSGKASLIVLGLIATPVLAAVAIALFVVVYHFITFHLGA